VSSAAAQPDLTPGSPPIDSPRRLRHDSGMADPEQPGKYPPEGTRGTITNTGRTSRGTNDLRCTKPASRSM